ncbi:MAG TPA: bifunctional phosphopantothenoylcysteine decarboxylase/phosphopantothenate--cysteine ligase CoaBC [Xanthobacteraceae bacterium]|nr:bifunctional phosphopantothenoylcysteine decarboxylase/phosphopantothenate--cysteine ligase CoaBC [Xanthobacteraceae bacterium]
MASLTVRQLDEKLKTLLRVRAARHQRSMEDEVRFILRQAAEETGREAVGLINPPYEPRASPAARVAASTETKRIVLIIGGGIAGYKSLDLIRRLRERHYGVRCVLTPAAQHFITPLAASALAGEPAYTDLFDPRSELDVGHIRLARDCDLIVVAPATADLMAKMAGGHADDLATAVLLATDKPVLLAPAMNPHMWGHGATRRNLAQLAADGIVTVGPNAGEMAERGEAGVGRMAEPLDIAAAAERLLAPAARPLAGKRVLITSGPTHEPIDPVRYIANRSSGKQGHAIARAASDAGAAVTVVSGPVNLPDPPGVEVVHVESARDMLAAVERALPADIAVFAAAVADWRVAHESGQKMKKDGSGPPRLAMTENPDILATIAHLEAKRPPLVIGFAAETEHVVEHAKAKLKRKGCDWILANDVSAESGVMGGDVNRIHLVTADGVEDWPTQSKDDVARMLVGRIVAALGAKAGAKTGTKTDTLGRKGGR